MFKIPSVNVIESDECFAVKVLGRTGLKYSEGERSLHIDSEILASDSPTAMMVDKSSIRHWDPPHSDQLIDEAQRERIINNIREAFRFKGHEIEVV